MNDVSPAVADEARPAPEASAATRSFITTAQLREIIPLSRRTLFEWRRKNVIPSISVGAKILYHWPSVEAALLRHQTNGGAHAQ